ncbi:hypothetical protein V6R85_01480 [Agrobacterium sp. CCNWLW32]
MAVILRSLTLFQRHLLAATFLLRKDRQQWALKALVGRLEPD